MEFTVGDKVFVEDSAEEDCHAEAWKSIKVQRYGIVKAVRHGRDTARLKRSELALEFPDDFAGGHYCTGVCLPKRGQFVMSNNVTLCFEDSRPVETVPRITL